MPQRRLNVAQAFASLQEELKLQWVAGHKASDRLITRDTGAKKRPRLIGTLNYNSANRIQLLGSAEVKLYSGRSTLEANRFEYSLAKTCNVIIVTDNLEAPACLNELAENKQIALWVSALPYSQLRGRIRDLFTQMLADRVIIHGVMMDVHGTGVLITGDASVGKSELALELISRGHILVADDAPEFTRIAPGTVECRCPPILKDFLEVRGLGILNIALMYGDAHTRERKILRFIVHLLPVSGENTREKLDQIAENRIGEPAGTREVLGVNVPERKIPVAPGRNLAVLVEAAVRDQILRAGGYSASRDLIEKQSTALANAYAANTDRNFFEQPKSGTEANSLEVDS